MMAAIGCAIDYSNASMIRTKLQAAADAAALATVSINSPVIATAKGMTGSGTVSGGSTYAANFFSANLPAGYTSVISHGHRDTKRNDNHRRGVVFHYSFHLLHGDRRLSEHHDSGLIHGELYAADIHQFLSDARRLRIDELPVDDRRASKTDGRQSRQLQATWLSQRLPVRLPFHRAGGLRAKLAKQSLSGTDPRRRVIVTGVHTEPIPGRILPRIYHFALGDHAGVFHKRNNQYNQRKQRKLDQYAGQLLLDCRHDFLHPIARRCRRLCRNLIADAPRRQPRPTTRSQTNSRSDCFRLSKISALPAPIAAIPAPSA